MTTRIMRLHESRVPKHFTPRMAAQVRYGTYKVGQIIQFEAMRAKLNANKPLTIKEKPASLEEKLAFTEYCIINNPDDLRSAFEKGSFPEMLGLIRDIEESKYSPSGRFLGMYYLEVSGINQWHLDSLVTARYRPGLRIFELGPGTTQSSITHARYHPDHFIVTAEASAINVHGIYQNLDKLGYVTRPLTNLRIFFGDIRFMTPPADFTADILLANWVFWHQNEPGDGSRPRQEDVDMFKAFLKWSSADAILRLSPPLAASALGMHIKHVMKMPENSERKLFFGIK